MTPTPDPIRALHRRRVGEPHLTGIYHRVEGAPGGVWGDLSGVRGDLSAVWGDLDLCGLTDEMRAAGVDVSTLIVPVR